MQRGEATNSAKNERTNDTAYPCCPDVVGEAICIVRIEFPARAARDGAAPVIAVCAFDFGLTVLLLPTALIPRRRPLQNPPIARGSIRFSTSSRRMK